MKHNLSFALFLLSLSASLSAEIRLELVSSTTQPYIINSVEWCQSCSFLAAGGQDETPEGDIQPFLLNQITKTLVSAGDQSLFGSIINSISWRSDCKYIAAAGLDESVVDAIQIYSFDPTTPGSFNAVGLPLQIGHFALNISVDWCPESNLIALTGFENLKGNFYFIDLVSFDETSLTLTPTGTPIEEPGELNALQWCGNNCHYLAVGGREFLGIYALDQTTYDLSLTCSAEDINNVVIYTLDWCPSCSYLAIGGMNLDSGLAFAAVYQFNPENIDCLTRVAWVNIIEDIAPTRIASLAWCGCNYLAMAKANPTFIDDRQLLLLYAFNPTRGLSLLQAFDTEIIGSSLAWCGGCDYLALGGTPVLTKSKAPSSGIINLYQTTFC